MAVTKFHAIRSTLGKAINYICNEHKTDDQVLITSFGCAPETAEYDFNFSLSKAHAGGKNLAFHLIQPFASGETTGEEAHRISQELADCLLQGRYSYVLATLVDRQHIHSHIIFCAVNNIDYNPFLGFIVESARGHIKLLGNIGCRRFICAGSIMEYEVEAAIHAQGSHPGMGYIYGMGKHIAHCMCKSVFYCTFCTSILQSVKISSFL